MGDERRLPSRDDYFGTLSDKFREDIKRIFYPASKSQTILEMGVDRGYTTRSLSGIFGRVVAIDYDESSLRRTREFNGDRSNITYLRVDLNVADEWDRHLASLKPHCILLDADHGYAPVKLAVESCIRLFENEVFLIFDDYADGHAFGVQRAVNEFIEEGNLRLIEKIGQPKEYGIGRGWSWSDHEGVVTEIV